MKVFTIGYEGLNMDDFMSLLSENSIETIVDIRELPFSRKPGFSKKPLTNTLNLSGIEYIHMVELGCPRHVRHVYRVDGDWKRYTTGFLKHLKTQKDAIVRLADLVQSSTCALLCYEADFNFCHRSMVADAVNKQCGVAVEHIPVKRVASACFQMVFA
ncbi:DUF488 family protein [Xylella fastidiosa]|uniref:DUF488 domain-containing protein n=1 Tax=Xylella fastidiosa TaxID=2371 RepID=UPI000057A758|nr:DUF488 domain-containing protein [Xylella fastidiosa]UIX80956.1 DUF488 domain-containing protein [Xylella fastidiosa subsp. sandyi]